MFADLPTLWRIRPFRYLLIARTVSNIGNAVAPIALAFGVLELPGSSASSLSFVTASSMVPIVLFLLVGGVVADRFGRALLVGATDVIGSVAVAITAALFISGHASVLLLCVLAAIFGLLNALWYPAFSGLIPEIVPAELLQPANSLQGIASNIGFTIGASIGGLIVSTAGAGWAIGVDSLSFLIAGLLVLQIKTPRPIADPSHERETMFHQLRTGWHEFASRRWLVATVVSFSVSNMCFEGFLAVLAPVQMKEAFDGPRSLGIMMFAFGLGAFVGMVLALRYTPRYPLRVGLLALPMLGIWALVLAAAAPMWVVALIALGSGAALDFFFVMWMTTLHTRIPSDAMSRVGSYDAFGANVFSPLGLLFAGPLAEWIGVTQTLAIAGSVMIVSILSTVAFRDVRNLERIDVNAPEVAAIEGLAG